MKKGEFKMNNWAFLIFTQKRMRRQKIERDNSHKRKYNNSRRVRKERNGEKAHDYNFRFKYIARK